MSATDFETGAAACPGCSMASVAAQRARGIVQEGDQTILLSLPTIHCASCISNVEQGMLALDEVHDIRVNLTRKRATIHAAPGADVAKLTRELSRMGYEAQPLDGATLSADQSDRAAKDLVMRLGVAGFAMMNVMLLSVAVWSGAADHTRDLFHWLSAAIALPTIAFSAQPFFIKAWGALRHASLNMDVPISLAIILAAGMSLFETTQSGEHAYFDAALSLTFFLLAGRYLDQRTRTTARSAATELAALEAPTAIRVIGDQVETVPVKQLAIDDIVLVRPGGKVPVDGVIEDGSSELDRAFLTGESDPIPANVGSEVRAGEVNLSGPLHIRATAVGKDTFLHSLADLIAIAEESKSRYNSLADRAAQIYAPAVHLLAFAAFVLWMYMTGGDVRYALNIAVATLIITCPCALGLAVPAVSTVASGALFKKGLLVKHATALERLAEVNEVIFDKTGTLTLGKPSFINADSLTPAQFAIAGKLADASEHPRSVAVSDAAHKRDDLPMLDVTGLQEHPGLGIEAWWDGQMVRLGRARWADPDGSHDGTVLKIGDTPALPLQFEDTVRPGAAELIATLKAQNIPVTLLSGDTAAHVQRLADELGIDNARAGMLPDEKVKVLEDIQSTGKRVLMVGDGLNDTAALAMAHVSIAPASALDATRVAADMVLVAPTLANVAEALRIAKRAKRRILENFGVAAVYNAIAIPLAFFGFATPLTAAIAMSSSSIIVSLNALRTR